MAGLTCRRSDSWLAGPHVANDFYWQERGVSIHQWQGVVQVEMVAKASKMIKGLDPTLYKASTAKIDSVVDRTTGSCGQRVRDCLPYASK